MCHLCLQQQTSCVNESHRPVQQPQCGCKWAACSRTLLSEFLVLWRSWWSANVIVEAVNDIRFGSAKTWANDVTGLQFSIRDWELRICSQGPNAQTGGLCDQRLRASVFLISYKLQWKNEPKMPVFQNKETKPKHFKTFPTFTVTYCISWTTQLKIKSVK